jgi:hypothetical protein
VAAARGGFGVCERRGEKSRCCGNNSDRWEFHGDLQVCCDARCVAREMCKVELIQKCPTSEATGLTLRSLRIRIRNRCRSATPAGRSLPRCALETPPAIARWSHGLSSWPRAAERWFTAPALERVARADCPGHGPAASDGRKTGRIHAARSAQGPGLGFRPGCSGINRELRCPVK